uniref:Uncharacterized protein n=1 Tax=viral metagenome TaxID=1070528 RepID=A0A6M3LHX6_9ZZZZ
MSHFYASIQGNGGEATRTGSKKSGVEGHIRGWNIGVRVVCTHENGKDVIRVYKTGGSNKPYGTLVLTFYDDSGE